MFAQTPSVRNQWYETVSDAADYILLAHIFVEDMPSFVNIIHDMAQCSSKSMVLPRDVVNPFSLGAVQFNLSVNIVSFQKLPECNLTHVEAMYGVTSLPHL